MAKNDQFHFVKLREIRLMKRSSSKTPSGLWQFPSRHAPSFCPSVSRRWSSSSSPTLQVRYHLLIHHKSSEEERPSDGLRCYQSQRLGLPRVQLEAVRLLNALRELGCVLQSPVLRELGCVLQSPVLRELGCVLQSPVLRELGCVLRVGLRPGLMAVAQVEMSGTAARSLAAALQCS